MKKIGVSLVLILVIAVVIYIFFKKITVNSPNIVPKPKITITQSKISPGSTFPLAIENLRMKTYKGSNLTFEKELASGTSFKRYLVSYLSDGLKIYGQLTIPQGQKPPEGWPVIIFNHGYIPPNQYSTENSYESFIEPFATAGYIVFKPDFRGNGNSEGTPAQVYISPGYIIDSLNALSSVKKFKDANPNSIGVMGHSMGGNITLHDIVISKDFKAAVIFSGVVGNYSDILSWWNKRISTGVLTTENDQQTAKLVSQFVSEHGTPENNPGFWNTIDPLYFVSDINIPVQIDVGTNDQTVPPNFSSSLKDALKKFGKTVDYNEYQGADHNLYPDTSSALQHALIFLNSYLK